MGKQIYDLLSINDTSSRQMRLLKRAQSNNSYTLDIDEGQASLRGQLIALIDRGLQFRNCVFTTHGSSGTIYFGDTSIDDVTWYREFYPRPFDRLFPFSNTKLYFAGCNVADGEDGWKFLEAAARSMLGTVGGVAMGWTSLAFGSPFSGHSRHLWGDTRQVEILPGGDSLRFYENWMLLTDGTGPVTPDGRHEIRAAS